VKQGEQHTEERALEVENLFGRTSPNFQSAKLRFHHESILRPQWPWPGKYARNLIKRVMRTSRFLPLFGCRQLNVRDLDSNRRLTRQRKHLVHSDSGPDRCITQAGLANLFPHPAGSKFSNVSQHRGETLFSLGYVLGFTRPDSADSMLGKAKRFGNLQHAPIGVSE
jgi:hypothetical protein